MGRRAKTLCVAAAVLFGLSVALMLAGLPVAIAFFGTNIVAVEVHQVTDAVEDVEGDPDGQGDAQDRHRAGPE